MGFNLRKVGSRFRLVEKWQAHTHEKVLSGLVFFFIELLLFYEYKPRLVTSQQVNKSQAYKPTSLALLKYKLVACIFFVELPPGPKCLSLNAFPILCEISYSFLPVRYLLILPMSTFLFLDISNHGYEYWMLRLK